MTIASEQLKLNGKDVTVRELTMGEVVTLLRERGLDDTGLAIAQRDFTSHVLHEGEPGYLDTLLMCDIAEQDLDGLSQAEYSELRAACKRKNPDVFNGCRRGQTVTEQIQQMNEMLTRLAMLTEHATSSDSSKTTSPVSLVQGT